MLQGDPHLGDVVVGADELQARIAELGKEITADYADRPPLLVCVLKGAFPFLADLARRIDLPIEVDFMAVSSYGSATKTSGVVRIVKDLDVELRDRHVLIVEDIVDSGLTLRYLRRNLDVREPASRRGVRAAREGGPPAGRDAARLRRVPHPARLRRRVRPRRRPSATATSPTSACTGPADSPSAARPGVAGSPPVASRPAVPTRSPRPSRSRFIPFVVLAVALLVVGAFLLRRGGSVEKLTLDEFEALVAEGRIETATIKDRDHTVVGELDDGTEYKVAFPAEFGDELTAAAPRGRPARRARHRPAARTRCG